MVSPAVNRNNCGAAVWVANEVVTSFDAKTREGTLGTLFPGWIKFRLSQKLFTYRAGADKMGQQAKVPCLVSDTTGDDCRMNAEALC